MTFREGLMRARSQLVFLAALIVSFSLIVWLESIDLQITDRPEPVERPAVSEQAQDVQQRRAEAILASTEAGLDASDPARVAAYLNALAAASQVGLIDRPDAISKIEAILGEVPDKNDSGLAAAVLLAQSQFPELSASHGEDVPPAQ